jgi:hypothetical protein
MRETLIKEKKTAILITCFYIYSAVQATRVMSHVPKYSAFMPISTAIVFIEGICLFLIIQRGTKNIFEKVAAFASAGALVPQLVRLVCGEFHVVTPFIFASLYLDAALTVTATIAIIARTIELFIAGRESLGSVPIS